MIATRRSPRSWRRRLRLDRRRPGAHDDRPAHLLRHRAGTRGPAATCSPGLHSCDRCWPARARRRGGGHHRPLGHTPSNARPPPWPASRRGRARGVALRPAISAQFRPVFAGHKRNVLVVVMLSTSTPWAGPTRSWPPRHRRGLHRPLRPFGFDEPCRPARAPPGRGRNRHPRRLARTEWPRHPRALQPPGAVAQKIDAGYRFMPAAWIPHSSRGLPAHAGPSRSKGVHP